MLMRHLPVSRFIDKTQFGIKKALKHLLTNAWRIGGINLGSKGTARSSASSVISICLNPSQATNVYGCLVSLNPCNRTTYSVYRNQFGERRRVAHIVDHSLSPTYCVWHNSHNQTCGLNFLVAKNLAGLVQTKGGQTPSLSRRYWHLATTIKGVRISQ